MNKIEKTSSTTKENKTSPTDVILTETVSVTYIFRIVSTKSLTLPYAVEMDGKVRDDFKSKPALLKTSSGKIDIRNLKPNQSIRLFLNSDADPRNRNKPVYQITTSTKNIVVEINEKLGKHSGDEKLIKDNKKSSETVDVYTALLTGDIWMKISHKYSISDVNGILANEPDKTIKQTVSKIYSGLDEPNLLICHSAGEINIIFQDSDNCVKNISDEYNLLKQGLTRVHPADYAALFIAAREAKVQRLVLTSTWRPLLGSIAHRAGLGLDVSYIDSELLNRQELRKKSAVDTNAVSEREKILFADLEKLKSNKESLGKSLEKANKDALLEKEDSSALMNSRTNTRKIKEEYDHNEIQLKKAEIEWLTERDKNESSIVRRFREALASNKYVGQLFDPWFMDVSTQDSSPAIPNLQKNENEKLHAHHLHITAHEPKIL